MRRSHFGWNSSLIILIVFLLVCIFWYLLANGSYSAIDISGYQIQFRDTKVGESNVIDHLDYKVPDYIEVGEDDDIRFRDENLAPHDRDQQIPSTPSSTGPITLDREEDKEIRDDKDKKRDILFLKTHKCGTSSLVNAFYLYGVRRKLNFVINPFRRMLNVTSPNILPPRYGQDYNIQCGHTKFNPEIAHRLLPKNRTFYTTIVRSNIPLFKSAYVFFGYDRYNNDHGNRSLDESVAYFLNRSKKIRPTNETVPIGWVFNSMANDLGFREYLPRPGHIQQKIDDFIRDLYREFDLVMLTDYFDESLVMLKEMMGLENRDILYMKRLSNGNPRKKMPLSFETQKIIKEINLVDVQLYNFFYQIFQMKVDDYGREKFQEKVAEYRQYKLEFENKCFNKSAEIVGAFNTQTWEYSEFGMTDPTCQFLQYMDSEMAWIVSELQVTNDFSDQDYEERLKVYKKKPLEDWQIEMLHDVQEEYN